MMNVLPDEAGRLWIQVGEDKLSILSFFDWEYAVAMVGIDSQMTIQDQGFGVEEKALKLFSRHVEHKFDVGGVNDQLEGVFVFKDGGFEVV